MGAIASPRKACIYVEADRQQRAGLFLRDVKYRLHAEFNFIPKEKRPKTQNPLPCQLVSVEDTADLREDDSPAKYAAMFERRAKKGQCFNQPYLGCREFAAQFSLIDPQKERSAPIPETREFGWMLYDMDYSDPSTPKPLFFNAKMQHGVINVPIRENKEEVRG